MTVEERVDKIMADAFRDHIDAQRFRANYPKDWELWLRNAIVQAVHEAVAEYAKGEDLDYKYEERP